MSNSVNLANEWVATNKAIVVLVGVPIWTVLVTSLLGWFNHRATLKSERASRYLQTELKIAEFQYGALEKLQLDFSNYISALRSWRLRNDPNHYSVIGLYNLVLLQLDMREVQCDEFVEISELLTLDKAPDFPEFNDGYERLKAVAQNIIKNERHDISQRLRRIGKP